MKFERNAKIFRGHLDVTPFAGVFFCFVILLLLATFLMAYPPGVRVELPASGTDLSVAKGPTVSVTVDKDGIFYFENKIVGQKALQEMLRVAAEKSPQPLTLIVQADKDVTVDKENGLEQLAGTAGIKTILRATRPRLFDAAVNAASP